LRSQCYNCWVGKVRASVYKTRTGDIEIIIGKDNDAGISEKQPGPTRINCHRFKVKRSRARSIIRNLNESEC